MRGPGRIEDFGGRNPFLDIESLCVFVRQLVGPGVPLPGSPSGASGNTGPSMPTGELCSSVGQGIRVLREEGPGSGAMIGILSIELYFVCLALCTFP